MMVSLQIAGNIYTLLAERVSYIGGGSSVSPLAQSDSSISCSRCMPARSLASSVDKLCLIGISSAEFSSTDSNEAT
jgi:hypothetical protein